MAGGNLTDAQKKKFEYLFKQFYDVNKDGVIGHADFTELAKAMQKLRNWPNGDARLQQWSSVLERVWTALRSGADANQDHKVTMEEWLAYWSAQYGQGGKLDVAKVGWVKDYMDFWFDLLDISGDGLIDENEFTKVCVYFGIPESNARQCYKKFAVKNVDKRYFAQLWMEYLNSSKSGDLGNYVFGSLS